MDDSIKKLSIMLDELADNNSLSQLSTQRLKQALTKLADGSAKTMDEAFGVNTKLGVNKSGARLIRFRREEKLRELLEADINKGMSKWEAAVKLNASLQKFTSRTYSRMKKNSESFNQANEEERKFFNLYEEDKDFPFSVATLTHVLN